MKVLIAGWFSFDFGAATVGDLQTRQLLCQWLASSDIAYDVAAGRPFTDGVDWQKLEARDYSHVIFVCGPFYKMPQKYSDWLRLPIRSAWDQFFERFKNCRLVGLNVSMIDLTESPFTLLFERDSESLTRPDLAFIVPSHPVPVVGLLKVHHQPEYKTLGMHDSAHDAIGRLINARSMALVPIDTRLDVNAGKLRNGGEIESLIAKMDVVITTRLHGMVLAIKNGVPALAVDAIKGGAKIARQAERIGWPIVFTADKLSDQALLDGFDYCLTEEARRAARECALRAAEQLAPLKDEFLTSLKNDIGLDAQK